MIIACSACSARFRLADEKVGPQGARVRCSRCGHLFTVRPPEPLVPPPPETHLPPPPPPPPPFGAHAPGQEREPTGTGGWPTGVLDLDGAPASAPESPSSVGQSLAGQSLVADPFAAFTSLSAPPPEEPRRTPVPAPAEPGPEPVGVDDLGALPVTDLSALERTGAVPVPAPLPPEPTPSVDGDLALEDRTPATASAGLRATWGQPEASQAVAVGPDGFQEVDLRGGAPADPDFDALATGLTEETPVAPRPEPTPPARTPPAAAPPAPQAGAPGEAAGTPPAPEVTEGRKIQPARVRAAAMNVLSLAALLVVTTGIVAWWRGERPGNVIRWPWGGAPAAVEVRQVSSGIYEGTGGMPVVFVRGAVRAGGAPLDGPVAVRVELSRGGRTLSSAVANAGAVPSAEEVAVVATPDDLGRLVAALDARAPRRLEAGAELPFLALLPAPEGDAGTLRFRVEPVPPKGR